MPADMEKPEIWIKTNGAEGRKAIFEQHSVREGQKSVHRVPWWPAVSRFEVEFSTWDGCLEHPSKLTEVQGGSLTFCA